MTSQRGKRSDPRYRQITALIPKDLHVTFKARCATVEQDMSDVVESLIKEWIEGKDDDKPCTANSFLEFLVCGEEPTEQQILNVAYESNIDAELLSNFVALVSHLQTQ